MKLNFPDYNFTIKQEQGNALIFDIIRKKYVRLSPEEWVRQHVIAWLTSGIGVPEGLISVERAFDFNGLRKRFDVCVAGPDAKMQLLVECKAPGVKLSGETLRQAGIYHRTLGVSRIFLSNGIQHIFMRLDPESGLFVQEPELPPYRDWF